MERGTLSIVTTFSPFLVDSGEASGAWLKVETMFSSIFHMAPVAGSTISRPMMPPKSRLPKYHPLMDAFRGMLWVTPFRLNSTTYLAGWKYPLEELRTRVAGVTPVLMARPLAFLMVKVAPGGLLDTVTGYWDLLTMLAQAVIQRHVPPMTIRVSGPRMMVRRGVE